MYTSRASVYVLNWEGRKEGREGGGREEGRENPLFRSIVKSFSGTQKKESVFGERKLYTSYRGMKEFGNLNTE